MQRKYCFQSDAGGFRTGSLVEINGVSMEVPENLELGQCFIISQVVAEVNFTLDDASYLPRFGCRRRFCRNFEEFEEEVVSIAASGRDGCGRGTDH